MASVHRGKRSPYWQIAFRGPDGRLVLRSSKQTDKATALTMALEFERATKLAKRGSLVESQARSILNGILERAGHGEVLKAVVSTAAHFKAWLEEKGREPDKERAMTDLSTELVILRKKPNVGSWNR